MNLLLGHSCDQCGVGMVYVIEVVRYVMGYVREYTNSFSVN